MTHYNIIHAMSLHTMQAAVDIMAEDGWRLKEFKVVPRGHETLAVMEKSSDEG